MPLTEGEIRLVKSHVRNVGFWVNGIWALALGKEGKGL